MNKLLLKWNSIPDSVKSSIAFAFSSFIIKGIAFLTTPIFTRVLSVEDYGMITTYNSWVTIIEIFALLGLTSAGVFNVGLNENKNNRNRYISICLGLCNITTILAFIIIFLFKYFFGWAIILNNELLLVMFIHFLFSPAQIFWITKQKYEYKYKLATIITVASVFVGQIFALVGVLLFKNNKVLFKIIGNELGVLLFAIPLFCFLLKKGKIYINKKEWIKVLMLALPLIPHYLAQHIMSSSDKIMISNLVGTGDAAIYGVVVNIGMIGTVFWTAINGSLVPFTFESINNNKTDKVNYVSKLLIVGYFVICFFIMLIAPEILKVLAPEQYYKGIYCVPPIIIVVFLQALYNLYANIEFYHKRTKNITVATIIATIINLVLNYIFIPKYSYIAASYTTLISYVVLVIAHYIGYKKCTKEQLYNNKFIFLTTTILLLISIIFTYIYSFTNIIRYIIIMLLFIILFMNRNRIKTTLLEMKY